MASNVPDHLREDLQLRAWLLKGQGRSQAAIARELSGIYPGVRVGQSSVSRWITKQTRRTLARIDDEAAYQLAHTIEQLRNIDGEAAAAWERSKTSRKEAIKTTVGEKSTTVAKIIDREGNPAWLDRRMAALDKLCQILRVDARFAPAPPAADQTDEAATIADALREAEADDQAYLEANPPAEPNPAG